MANEWNIAYPLDHTKIGDVPGAIRTLKASVKTQLGHEHETPVDGDATGSEHSSGSAVAYEGTDTPTNRPDGVTALADNAIDRGRLWVDDNFDPPVLKRWAGSAWEKAIGMSPVAYAGGETITLPNGLIIKFGAAEQLTQYGNKSVTFGAAFPTAVIAGFCSPRSSITDPCSVITLNTTTIAVGFGAFGSGNGTFYWLAIGY